MAVVDPPLVLCLCPQTGKHGHAKCKFTGVDIFNGTKHEMLESSTHNVDIPNVTLVFIGNLHVAHCCRLAVVFSHMTADVSLVPNLRIPANFIPLFRYHHNNLQHNPLQHNHNHNHRHCYNAAAATNAATTTNAAATAVAFIIYSTQHALPSLIAPLSHHIFIVYTPTLLLMSSSPISRLSLPCLV